MLEILSFHEDLKCHYFAASTIWHRGENKSIYIYVDLNKCIK